MFSPFMIRHFSQAMLPDYSIGTGFVKEFESQQFDGVEIERVKGNRPSVQETQT